MSDSPTGSEEQSLPPLDPSVIESAPVEPEAQPWQLAQLDLEAAYNEALSYSGYLSERLAEAEAENEKLKGKQTVDDVKASLLAPYSSKVFWFVVSYCAVVGVLLILAGFKNVTGFSLSDAILGIIAGSTAVSVIGLIGMVITGLFGGSRTPPA